ncbi:hypothetical protein NKW54_15290 [Acetobacter cerevisiae]|uniref:Uncharacterized protein n=1 Tax=Acetobacter cerevisiae TaxID=178900 RepID=A0ABT1EV62_9PROT|nr:hypothetical protein [Acetobacter cerevisiae]MCP1247276.1 hypothetical protein [Acetobacter cerevisiae]MCP1256918.1 hypothetical protein [Acetobacter cerevisiae]
MEKQKNGVKSAVRAGDILRDTSGFLFMVGLCDDVRASPVNDSQTNVFLAQCTIEHSATNKEHQAALLLLSSPGGVCGEVTPERMQRGDIVLADIKDQRGRVTTHMRSSGALYTLHKSGAIEDRHVAAAEMWARDYETGILVARDPDAGKSGGKSDIEYAMLSRAAAVTRCESVRRCLGAASQRFLVLMMIDGLSVNQMRIELKQDHKKVAGAIELLLEQLVELYDGFPGRIMAS